MINNNKENYPLGIETIYTHDFFFTLSQECCLIWDIDSFSLKKYFYFLSIIYSLLEKLLLMKFHFYLERQMKIMVFFI